MKPLLEEIVANIVDSLVGPDKEFYEREFSFFTKVTSISGALKPYIKKSKAEKKARIDEELSKIEVDPGVYLPSSPESILVDIDYRSGRPLQSHAKAPFMATFKVKLATENIKSNESSELIANETTNTDLIGVVSKSVIFKVGDDCRQDVLALQLIATFKEIYQSVDLDLYLYPYRVVATAPGVMSISHFFTHLNFLFLSAV